MLRYMPALVQQQASREEGILPRKALIDVSPCAAARSHICDDDIDIGGDDIAGILLEPK